IHYSVAQALMRADRFAEAVPHLQRARDAGIAPGASGLELARSLAEAGRLNEARQALRDAEPAIPPDAGEQTHVDMGLLAMQLGDPAGAERLFRKAIAAYPSSAVAHEKLGLCLIEQGRAGEAAAALGRAVELEPSSATVRYNLAVALARDGRLAEAAAAARSALRLRPDYAPARAMIEQLEK
ncbi:MAG: tetratricopeptide repeat protein, partial [Acidobacteria bacterium]